MLSIFSVEIQQIISTFWWQTENNNQVLSNFDYNKRIFGLLILLKRPDHLETDKINQMVTLSVIIISGFHCSNGI
jgi:hypothetical protein